MGVGQWWLCCFIEKNVGIACFLPSQILTLQGVFLSPLFVLRESKTRDLEGGMLRTTHFSLLPYFYWKIINFSKGCNFILALMLKCELEHPSPFLLPAGCRIMPWPHSPVWGFPLLPTRHPFQGALTPHPAVPMHCMWHCTGMSFWLQGTSLSVLSGLGATSAGDGSCCVLGHISCNTYPSYSSFYPIILKALSE